MRVDCSGGVSWSLLEVHPNVLNHPKPDKLPRSGAVVNLRLTIITLYRFTVDNTYQATHQFFQDTIDFAAEYIYRFNSARKVGKMNSVASKRLFQEYKHLTTDPPDGITAGPVNEDDLFLWEAMIQGPEGTPYEGGVFPAELKFPKDYPLMPPTMKFLCDIWHPNGTHALFHVICKMKGD